METEEEFRELWEVLGFDRNPPQIDFEEHFVTLYVNDYGDPNAHAFGIFRDENGVTSIAGHKTLLGFAPTPWTLAGLLVSPRDGVERFHSPPRRPDGPF